MLRGFRRSRREIFIRGYAQVVIAGAFCVVVTASFKMLYVFVVLASATRKILRCHVTAHPTVL